MEKILRGKVIIKGIIHTLTGLYIGGSKETMEIGAIDSPVLRDAVTGEPYIPGSSLKGKMRALLERTIAAKDPNFKIDRNIGTDRNVVKIHVCDTKEQAAKCEVCRVFGSSGSKEGTNFPSRIRIRDAYFEPYTKKKLEAAETDFLFSEVKYENAIDRITAAANPRQIERVPAGSDFGFEIIYDVEEIADLSTDVENIAMLLQLIEDDYIGGNGSRGYGKVLFYLNYCVAKKIDAYKELTGSKYEKVVLQCEKEIKDETDYKDLCTIDTLKGKIAEVTKFFKEG